MKATIKKIKEILNHYAVRREIGDAILTALEQEQKLITYGCDNCVKYAICKPSERLYDKPCVCFEQQPAETENESCDEPETSECKIKGKYIYLQNQVDRIVSTLVVNFGKNKSDVKIKIDDTPSTMVVDVIQQYKATNDGQAAEIKEVKHVLFENVIAPNCPTCSDQMSNNCDNGQICMSKLLNAEFVRWDIKKLQAENAELEKQIEDLSGKVLDLEERFIFRITQDKQQIEKLKAALQKIINYEYDLMSSCDSKQKGFELITAEQALKDAK